MVRFKTLAQRVGLAGPGGSARTMAIHRSGTLALVTNLQGLVNVLRLAKGVWTLDEPIQGLGTSSSGVVMSPDGSKAYVSNFGDPLVNGDETVAVLSITDQDGFFAVADTGIRIFIPNGTPRYSSSAFRGWR